MKRSQILQKALDREIPQRDGAERLGVTPRHFRRLLQKARQTNPLEAVASQRRGRPSNRAIPAEVREKALELVREHYQDFGPTFAHEKLLERHAQELELPKTFCAETLRLWMTQAGLHKARRPKPLQIHPLRRRREWFGEMLQTDGSLHDWLEGRAEAFTLLVLIDDATSRITAARFVRRETTRDYLRLLCDHVLTWGCPYSIYSDRHGIFRVNRKQLQSESRPTHFARAARDLGIELICASTPQAKGRVERFFQTAQRRWCWEMRLAGIQTMEQANTFLPQLVADHNQRFAIEPHFPGDAHEPLELDENQLSRLLARHVVRTLSRNLTCQYKNRLYQVRPRDGGRLLRGAKILLMETLEGEVLLHGRGRDLPYEVCERGERQPEVQSAKGVNAQVDEVIKRCLQAPRSTDPKHPRRRFNSSELSK